MDLHNQSQLKKLKAYLQKSSRIVVFTGAGISTESGVSDYRSKGGIWDRFQPITIQEFLTDTEKRREYWRRKKEMFTEIKNARPNKGHLAIRRLEDQGKLLGIITQNIDGFHKEAGNQRVLELHGTNREVICLHCKKIGPFDPVYERLLGGEETPDCKDCGGLLKPNTISFGQDLNMKVFHQALEWVQGCDLLLAVGSTLIVEPAASLPLMAKQSGAALIIINRDPTPVDEWADLVIHADIGPVLEAAVE